MHLATSYFFLLFASLLSTFLGFIYHVFRVSRGLVVLYICHKQMVICHLLVLMAELQIYPVTSADLQIV